MPKNLVEVDIWYLTGQQIGIYPARFRKTLRFTDHSGVLTRLRKKLDTLQARERANFKVPLPTGIAGYFARWWRGRNIEKVMRLEIKLARITERKLCAELRGAHDVVVLTRSEYDRTTFEPLDRSGKNRLLAVLNDYHRWFVNDWVYVRNIRAWDPKTEHAPVLT